MKCPHCDGLREVLDASGDAMPCGACDGTGEELPDNAMPWEVQVEAADDFAASDEFVTYIETIMDEAEVLEA